MPAVSAPSHCDGALAIGLRPEAVRLVAADDPHALLSGVVSEVYFQGDHALAQVVVDGTAFLSAVREDVLPERGQSVGLKWSEDSIIPLVAE